MSASRTFAVILVLFGCLAALITHSLVLYHNGIDPVVSPIAELALTEDAAWFWFGLWLFALGHLALVLLLNQSGAGRFTKGAQFFLLLNAVIIFCLPWHFESLSLIELTPVSYLLWLLGMSVGFAMAFVSVALWRRRRATAIFTLICLLLWSVLVFVFFIVDASWIGAYQRVVGVVLLFWSAILGVSVGLYQPTRKTLSFRAGDG